MPRYGEADRKKRQGWSDRDSSLDFQDRIVAKVLARCRELLAADSVSVKNIYEDAWELVRRACQKAEELGIAVVTTVMDQSGQVVLTYRMEGALLVSNDMAYKKAYTAVGMKMQSKDLAPLTQPGQWLYQLETMTDNKIVSLAGGIPIYCQGQVIGAIGVSGGDSEQDQAIAEYALAQP